MTSPAHQGRSDASRSEQGAGCRVRHPACFPGTKNPERLGLGRANEQCE